MSRGPCEGEVCITCSDQGTVMTVIAVGSDGIAVCSDLDAHPTEVAVDLVESLAPGDRILVHAGVAIARLEPMRAS